MSLKSAAAFVFVFFGYIILFVVCRSRSLCIYVFLAPFICGSMSGQAYFNLNPRFFFTDFDLRCSAAFAQSL